MIHVASLVHDDVLDECDIRRGNEPKIIGKFVQKLIVVKGFLFSKAHM